MIDARINDGDVVYIKQQSDVDSGEIAAVLIDNEATLKGYIRRQTALFYGPRILNMTIWNMKTNS